MTDATRDAGPGRRAASPLAAQTPQSTPPAVPTREVSSPSPIAMPLPPRAVADKTRVARQPVLAAMAVPGEQTDPIPTGATRFVTAGGSTLVNTTLATYAPQTTSQHVTPRDPALAKYIASTDTMFPLNAERTNLARLATDVEAWATQHPDKVSTALQRPGMTAEQARAALHALSPNQVARLACAFAAEHCDFLTGKPAGPPQAFDSIGVDKSVERGKLVGVCRTYSEVTMSVFNALKKTQAKPSQLENTYCQQISGFGHRWNAFYTVEPSRRTVVTMTDGVWADAGQLEVNTHGRLYALQQQLMRGLEAHGGDPHALVERATSANQRVLGIFGGSIISADEIRSSGGMPRFMSDFRRLWLPQQSEVLERLAPDVRAKVLATLAKNHEPAPFQGTPDQKRILY